MEIKKYLQDNGIEFKQFNHPPVYTCEEAEKYSEGIKGLHAKNLFMKNKKGDKFFLVIFPSGKKLEIKELEKKLQEKIRFASEEDLKKVLGLTTGAVSPFGLINDDRKVVKVLIDKSIWESDHASFHPNINTETLELTKEGFHKYVEGLKNSFEVI
jgi:Ala-tRNA(Pro) deacylase